MASRSTEALIERLHWMRAKATNGPIGKRTSSFALYKLLSECMGAATHCMAVPEAKEELIKLLTPERENARSRKGQVNSTSSTFQLVCRYVFKHGTSEKADRSNASRYGKALEQAYEKGIHNPDLETWLRENGGVNALFLARPNARRSVMTKTLYLDRTIHAPKDGTVTLTLRRRQDGVFEVIGEPHVDPSQEEDPRDLRESLRSAGDVQSPAPAGRADGQASADADHRGEGIAPGGAAVHPRAQL